MSGGKSRPQPNSTATIRELTQERAQLLAKVEALHSLMEVSVIINSTLDLDELMALVMEKAQSLMNAEASSVMIINEEKGVLECPVALGEVGDKVKTIELPLDKGIAGWVATHGEPLIVPDAYRDSRFNPKVDEETGFRTRSILAAPLMVKDRLIGVAEVINRADGQPFDDSDLNLFMTFCRQVAMAIENARVHQLELEKQKIQQQLEAAKVIQQSFMPEECPHSPEGRFDIAAGSLAAASVGGDFYDFVEFDNQTIGISIGDVSGKGIPAALFMARFVSDFRLYAQLYRDPAHLLTAMNRLLSERSRRGMFVTALYGVLDATNRLWTFANAGHLPCLRVRSQGRSVELLRENTGIPLGVVGEYSYQSGQVPLEKGDALVLLTDGIIEARNPEGQMYSWERVQQAVLSLHRADAPAGKMLRALLKDVQEFSRGTEQTDDLTLVIIKVN